MRADTRRPCCVRQAARTTVLCTTVLLLVAPSSRTQAWGSEGTGQQEKVERAMREALADPYEFYESGKHQRLIGMVERNGTAMSTVIPVDTLGQLIAGAQRNRNSVLLYVLNLLQGIQSRHDSPERFCSALTTAATTLFERLHDPLTALRLLRLPAVQSCPRVPVSIQRMEKYLKHDRGIDRLLDEPWYDMSERDRRSYARRLADELAAHPETSLRIKALRRIGDVYYNLEMFRDMRTWYRKVVSLDSTLARETPIGYRLQEGGKRIMGDNLRILFIGVYVAVALVLLTRVIRAWGTFDGIFFVTSLGIFMAAYAAMVTIVFAVDARLFPQLADSLKRGVEYPVPLTRPVIPFTVMDTSILLTAALVCGLGLLPIVLAAFYASFRKPFSRLLLLTLVLLTAVSGWGHFFLCRAYDEFMHPTAIVSHGRVILDGELETLLVEDPRKVLVADPDFTEAENTDLDIFIEEHLPDGLKGKD